MTEPANAKLTRSENKERLREILAILKKHDLVRGLTPVKLRSILEDLGPTYIKLGQIMSMRSDMIPKAYCEALTQLRSAAPAMAFEEVRRVVENALGCPLEEAFAEFNEQPIGAASIAQVHEARRLDGRRVVVKVQREGIRETMAKDMALLRRAAALLKLAPGAGEVLDFGMILDEIWRVSQEEMDFNIEAANAEEFRRLNEGVVYVSCPEIDRDLTTAQVLTMEYIDGFSIDDTEGLLKNGYDLNEIGEKLADNYIKQIIVDGFFHADPHPGNIRIRGGKIVWIDMGMMGRLSAHDQQQLTKGVEAIARHDVEAIKEVVLAMGRCRGTVDQAKLYADLDGMLTRYGDEELAQLQLGSLMMECMDIAKAHRIAMPEGVTLLARGLGTIEGVVAALSPETNVVSIAAARATDSILRSIDLKKEMEKGTRSLLAAVKKAVAIPGLLSDSLKSLSKGETRVGLDVKVTEDTIKAANSLLGKFIACLLAFALLISSSILCTTGMQPELLGIPALGVVGYSAAVGLTIWVFVRISRDK